jgi:hypothetical protein
MDMKPEEITNELLRHMSDHTLVTNAYLRILTRTVEVTSIVMVAFLVLHFVFKVI